MHQHRILLCGVKIGRQHIETVYQIAAAAGKLVFAAFAHLHAAEPTGAEIRNQGVFPLLQIHQPDLVGGAEALAGINQQRSLL